MDSTPREAEYPAVQPWALSCALLLAPADLTWGRPVRRLARLGEQLLTEVKALRKMRLRRARASR